MYVRATKKDSKLAEEKERKKTGQLLSVNFTPVTAEPVTADPFASLVSKLSQLSVADTPESVTTHAVAMMSDLAASMDSVLPVETLQMWTASQAVNMLTYMPPACNKHLQVCTHTIYLL